ncbi:MAG: hypothetical protein IKZ97_01070 [Butyrivibrio sp.]|nr:hypothetical protein [Butyrivibrio sp.]
MNKVGLKVITGLATAGILAVTGSAGLQTIVGEIPAEEIETVEYKMEENDSSSYTHDDSPDSTLYMRASDLTYKYYQHNEIEYPDGKTINTFPEAIEIYITIRERYALVHSSVYGKQVLIHAMEEDRRDNKTYDVRIYTEQGKGKPLRMVGALESQLPIKIKDGVIYSCTSWTYETYVVSPDGSELLHKDYINLYDYSGYTNISGDKSTRVPFKGGSKEATELFEKTYQRAYDFDFRPGLAPI